MIILNLIQSQLCTTNIQKETNKPNKQTKNKRTKSPYFTNRYDLLYMHWVWHEFSATFETTARWLDDNAAFETSALKEPRFKNIFFIMHRTSIRGIPILHQECQRSAISGYYHRSLRRENTEKAVPPVVPTSIIKHISSACFLYTCSYWFPLCLN